MEGRLSLPLAGGGGEGEGTGLSRRCCSRFVGLSVGGVVVALRRSTGCAPGGNWSATAASAEARRFSELK